MLNLPSVIKLTGFVLLAIFCTSVYGDVFQRAQQDAFCSNDPTTMYFLTSAPGGYLFWAGRYLMLIFKWKYLGGILLAALLTGMACQVDSLLSVPRQWRGAAFLVPFGVLAWMAAQGTNLYFRAEPSRIILIPVGLFLILFALACTARFLRRKSGQKPAVPAPAKGWRSLPFGALLMLAAFGGLTTYALRAQQNTILTARMQNLCDEQDWDGVIEAALSARRPTRSIAAYHAIALVHTNQLIDRLFEIPYNYPDPRTFLDQTSGNAEYDILMADADLHAGLVQAGYHYALERMVMEGVTTRYVKIAIKAALLMGEDQLARKYLTILRHVPFEKAFIEQYEPYIGHPDLVAQDPEFATILNLTPQMDHYEQNYPEPSFIGYNLGFTEGTWESVKTSLAAYLYAKDIRGIPSILQAMLNNGYNLSPIAEQAVICLSMKKDFQGIDRQFPINAYTRANFQAFMAAAKPYIKDKDVLREKLKEDWLGSYFYYYYCNNNDSIATGKSSLSKPNGQVN